MTQPSRLRDLVRLLDEQEVEFVLVGGLAVNAWGHLRGTRDLDIVPDPAPENLERLASLLEGIGGRVEALEGRLAPSAIKTFLRAGDRTLVATDLGPVDVLQGLPQVPRYAELSAEAVAVDLEGVSVRVCSLESLLEMKRASSRPLDRDDAEALEEANRR